MTPRNDIAIYAPSAILFYEEPVDRDDKATKVGGGAELQTTMLALQLAQRGLSVAHVVFPATRPVRANLPVELVERPGPPQRTRRDRMFELARVWRALRDADARLYVFRGGGSVLMLIGALFCRLHRREFVQSASNDFDFLARSDRSRLAQALYRVARRRARWIVVQTEQQARLAREAMGDGARVKLIRSFAQPGPLEAPAASPDGFVWAGRIVPYKQPLRYVELAQALPAVPCRLVAAITHETPQPLLAEIQRAGDHVGNLKVLGPQPRARVLELMDRSVALVSTSEYEGMPNVFLEAWGRGVPVLSLHFDPDGVIARERLGVAASGSWERFVEGARTLSEDAQLRAEIGARARDYVARTHSPEAIGAQWAEALREALPG